MSVLTERKSVSKSVRMTPSLYDYIANYRGVGFNEQINNIIEDARDSEADRKRRIEQLDQQLARRKQLLDGLSVELQALQDNIRALQAQLYRY